MAVRLYVVRIVNGEVILNVFMYHKNLYDLCFTASIQRGKGFPRVVPTNAKHRVKSRQMYISYVSPARDFVPVLCSRQQRLWELSRPASDKFRNLESRNDVNKLASSFLVILWRGTPSISLLETSDSQRKWECALKNTSSFKMLKF